MSNPQYYLRLRSLPKPEYKLMRQLVDLLGLKDESELFAVALRLLYEVRQYKPDTVNGGLSVGQQWIVQVIDSYRSMTEEARDYSDI